VGFEGLLEGLFAAAGLAFHAGDGGGEVFDGFGLLRFFVGENDAEFGVDFQGGVAAGALEFEGVRGHGDIILDGRD
jgi:hypothetical protein